jgi:hypothetical protein
LEVESETVAATPPTVRQLATYDYMVVEEGAGRPVVDKILCRLEIESVYGSFVVAARMVCGRSMFGNESQSADDRRRVLPGDWSGRQGSFLPDPPYGIAYLHSSCTANGMQESRESTTVYHQLDRL